MTKKNELIIISLLSVAAIILGRQAALNPVGLPLYLAVGLFVIIVSLINIKFALCLLVMSMLLSPEISLAQVPSRAVVVRFDDLILILIFFVWLAKTAINRELPLIKATPLNKYIFCYLGACYIFTLKGVITGDVNFMKSFFYLLKYTEYFILFWMVYNVIQTKKDIKLLMTYATVTAIIVIIYGYMQTGRVVPPFDTENNSMGGYLTIVVSVAMGALIYHPSKKIKWMSLLIFLLCIPIFIRTISRASYMAFIASYISLILISKKARVLLLIFGITSVLLAPVVIPRTVFETLVNRVNYTFSGEYGELGLDPSGAARIISWKDKLKNHWPKHPLIGWGITGIGFIDSMYVRTFVEIGFIGFAAFIFMLYGIFRESRKIFVAIDDPVGKTLSIGLLAAFTGLLVHALTSNTFIIVRIMEPFWFLMAIVMALPKIGKA
ncbi:O-antigen ligase family protein [Elusimicrobiota bacterium]